jgi:YgiT-type zinc finger domain-containing protein
MKEEATTITLGENPVIVITGVPAEVCDVCGEEILDRDVTKKIEEIKFLVRDIWKSEDKTFPEEADIGGTAGDSGGVVRIGYDEEVDHLLESQGPKP